jgi:hypothetical protein
MPEKRSLADDFFACIEDFSQIKKHQILVIGGGKDARDDCLNSKVIVDCNWPSQWHTSFPAGYIRLRDSESYLYFDLSNRTVDGKPVFLFWYSNVGPLWLRQNLRRYVANWLDSASQEDLSAALDLLRGICPEPIPDYVFGTHSLKRIILVYTEYVPIRELEEFVAVITQIPSVSSAA